MKFLRVTMPDGSRWDVPAQVVIDDYRRCYGGTEPEPDDYALKDWAAGNMNWSDVVEHAQKFADGPALDAHDFQEGWVNGEKEVVEVQVIEGVAFVPLTDATPPALCDHDFSAPDVPGGVELLCCRRCGARKLAPKPDGCLAALSRVIGAAGYDDSQDIAHAVVESKAALTTLAKWLAEDAP